MRVLVVCAALASGPAWAAELANCGAPEWLGTGGWEPFTIACDVKNNDLSAIASISYRIVIFQPDRTVPWYDKAGAIDIPGGVEPHEARRVEFVGRPFTPPDDADMTKMVFSVIPTEIRDVNGAPIP